MANECPKCQTDNPNDSKHCKECATPLPEGFKVSHTKILETPVTRLAMGSIFAERYEVLEELGKGSMGEVYRVKDNVLDVEMALKIIKPEIAADKKNIERFRNELKFARQIRHMNVCTMFDLGEEKNLHYITMEYISGQDLKSLIRQTGQLTIGKALSIAMQICDGLDKAHSLGIVHRDLNSNNIMIDDNGNAWIMDFGIARFLKSKGITSAGVMVGTPGYISPEQVKGEEVDPRSDIYSLGVIVYEMLTGRMPFEGDTPLTIAMKHMTEAPKDPREFNTQLPETLSKIILKCLKKDKDKRYQSAKAVKAEFNYIDSNSISERVIPKRKSPASIAIAITNPINIEFNLKKLFIPVLIVATLILSTLFILQFQTKNQIEAKTIIMPSVTDMELEEAISIVLEHGFQVGRIQILTREGKEGTVVSQLPKAGMKVKANSLVNLFVLRAQSSPYALVDQILESLSWGNIAFSAPISIKLKDTAIIDLYLSLSEPINELKQHLEKEIDIYREEIEILGASIRVSNRMEARLTGYSFWITAITPELQAVGEKDLIEWKWEVKPKSEGLHTLHLTLSAILSINEKDTPRAIRTFDKKIKVKVSIIRKVGNAIFNFIGDNWKWAWVVILVPLVAWLRKLWKKWRRKRK